jgi:hypothetical protein
MKRVWKRPKRRIAAMAGVSVADMADLLICHEKCQLMDGVN